MDIDPAPPTAGGEPSSASGGEGKDVAENPRVRKEVSFDTQLAESLTRKRVIPRAKVPRTDADPRPSTIHGGSFLGTSAPRPSSADEGMEAPPTGEAMRRRRRSSLPTTGFEVTGSQNTLVNSWLKSQDVDTQEKILIEAWLDRMLGRVLATASSTSLQESASGGLMSSGLDRARLMFSGLESEEVDMVYRSLYAHTAGFYDFLKGGKGFEVDDENTEKIMVAFKLLTSHLQRWGDGEGLAIGQRRKSLGERRDRVGSVARKETAGFELRSKMEVRLMVMSRELEREKERRKQQDELIESLRKQIMDLEAALAALGELCNKMKAEMDLMSAKAQEEIDRLKKLLQEQYDQMSALRELLRQQEAELAEFRETLRLAQEKFASKSLEDAEALAKLYMERIAKLEKDIADLLNELARLRESELEARRQRDALQELYEFESTRNALLRLQIDELLRNRDKMNQDAELSQQKLLENARIIAEQQAEILALKSALERAYELLAKLQGVERENQALREKLKEYEKISDSLKALDQAMKAVTGDTSPDASWFGERAESLQRNGMKVLSMLNMANDAIKLLQEKLDERNLLLKELQDQLARTLAQIDDLEKRLNNALEQGQSKDESCREMQGQLRSMTDELERLRRLLAELQAKYDALKMCMAAEIERLKAELQALREALAAEKQKTADALAALKNQMDLVASLRQELDKARKQIEEQKRLLEEKDRKYERMLETLKGSKANNEELEALIDALRRELALLRKRLQDESDIMRLLEEERQLLLADLENCKKQLDFMKQELQDTIEAFMIDMNSLRDMRSYLQETKDLFVNRQLQYPASASTAGEQIKSITIASSSTVSVEKGPQIRTGSVEKGLQITDAASLVLSEGPWTLSPASPSTPRMIEVFQGGLSDPRTLELKSGASQAYFDLRGVLEEKNEQLRVLQAALQVMERQLALYGPHVTALVNLLWRVWKMATEAQRTQRELVSRLLQQLVRFWNSLGGGITGDDDKHLQYTNVLQTLQEITSMNDLEMEAEQSIANEVQGHLHNLPPLPPQGTDFAAKQYRLHTVRVSNFEFSSTKIQEDRNVDRLFSNEGLERASGPPSKMQLLNLELPEASLLANLTPKDLQEVLALERRLAIERVALQKEVQRLQAKLLAEQAARRWRDKYTRELYDKLMGKGKVSRAAQTAASGFWSLLIPHPLSPEETDMLEFRTYWQKLARKAVDAEPLTERFVRQTITDIYAAKIKDDIACMRSGKTPHEMPEYVYLYYRKRYGLTHMREDHLLELLASLIAYRDIPEVSKFALSAAVLDDDEYCAVARPVTPLIPPREDRVPPQQVVKTISSNVEMARLPLGDLQFHQTTAATNEDIWKGDSLCTPRSILSARDPLYGGLMSARSSEPCSSRLSTPMTSSRLGSPRSGSRFSSPRTGSRLSSPRTSIAASPRTKGSGMPIMPLLSTSVGNPRWSSKTVNKTENVPIVKETKLLGMHHEELKHPLAEHLVEWKPLSCPTMLDLELLAHPLTEEATELVSHVPGIEALLAVMVSPQFIQAASNIDLGVPIGEMQLPQMHVLLEQTCNILDMDCPLMFVRDSPYCRAYTWCLQGSPPAIIFNSAVFDILEPAELQALMAQQLTILKWPKYRHLAMAWTILILAPALLEPDLAPSGVKLMDNSNLRDLKWGPSNAAFDGKWPVSSALANSLDRWIRYQELVGDRAALIVTESLLVVVSANLKMAAGSHTLAKQLNIEALLEQGHKADAAAQSTMLRNLGLQQSSSLSDNLNIRTEFTSIAHFNSMISKKTLAANVSKSKSQSFGVELKSLQLGSSSHSLAVLRARELSRWAHTEEIAPMWHTPVSSS